MKKKYSLLILRYAMSFFICLLAFNDNSFSMRGENSFLVEDNWANRMYYGVWRPSMRMAEENQDNVNTCTWNRYWGTFSGIFAGVGAGLLISELVDETTSPQPAYFAGGGALVGLVGGFVIDKITKGKIGRAHV